MFSVPTFRLIRHNLCVRQAGTRRCPATLQHRADLFPASPDGIKVNGHVEQCGNVFGGPAVVPQRVNRGLAIGVLRTGIRAGGEQSLGRMGPSEEGGAMKSRVLIAVPALRIGARPKQEVNHVAPVPDYGPAKGALAKNRVRIVQRSSACDMAANRFEVAISGGGPDVPPGIGAGVTCSCRFGPLPDEPHRRQNCQAAKHQRDRDPPCPAPQHSSYPIFPPQRRREESAQQEEERHAKAVHGRNKQPKCGLSRPILNYPGKVHERQCSVQNDPQQHGECTQSVKMVLPRIR